MLIRKLLNYLTVINRIVKKLQRRCGCLLALLDGQSTEYYYIGCVLIQHEESRVLMTSNPGKTLYL